MPNVSKSTEQPKVAQEEVSRILVSTPPEVDRGLFDMMEIYGRDCSDPDIQEKVKYVSDALGDHPKDNLLHILTEIGQTPMGETKLGRVYKYLRLRQSADKALKQYQNIQKDMNYLRANQW